MGKEFYNKDGQPPRDIGMARRTARSIDELLGICKGIMADGVLQKEEIYFLFNWFKQTDADMNLWPFNVLNNRIDKIFEDGIVDEKEKRELFDLINNLLGTDKGEDLVEIKSGETIQIANMSTSLPVTKPEPPVIFKDKLFCFTGKFYWGTRDACECEILARNGLVNRHVVLNTDYLVIGQIGSRDWKHSSFGLKIMNAVEMREKTGISIISEEHWTRHL